MTAAREVVELIDCDTAEQFLNVLSPQDALWGPDPSLWIFRGHAQADWLLLSTAQRADLHEDYNVKWAITRGWETGASAQESDRRRAAEGALVDRFRRALDEAALNIPVNPFQSTFSEIVHSFEVDLDGLPLLALAQHLGLPTSLLDWTRIAPKGAYFAAGDFEVAEDEGRLAVWGLNTGLFASGIFVDPLTMRIVTAPNASNPNLHAQSGLFTQARGGEMLAVDDYVRAVFDENSAHIKVPLPWMRKLTLRRTFRKELLRLLSYGGINGSSMFPGYSGVVRRLREEALWKP
jgi:hypothetical protein